MKLYQYIGPQVISETKPKQQVLDEIDGLADSISANMDKEIKIPKDVLNSFKIKDHLNPEIWIKNHLDNKVRIKLIKIANDFIKDLDLPKEVIIADIIFTGSLANYNWSKYSDIDLHVVIDYNQFDTDPIMVDEYFYALKAIWNSEHDIKIFNYPVELYVQNINHKLVASAVYSVLQSKWIKKPKQYEFDIDKIAIKNKADAFIYQLRDIKQDYADHQYQTVVDKVTRLKGKIKRMRNAGLEKGGEYSQENIVFKVLRRTPFLDILDSFKHKSYDKLMSLSEIQSINESNKLFIDKCYSYNELPEQIQNDIDMQFNLYGDVDNKNKFDGNPEDYKYCYMLLPWKEIPKIFPMVKNYLKTTSEKHILDKLSNDIKKHGLHYPSVGSEGNHRAAYHYINKINLPYLRIEPINYFDDEHAISEDIQPLQQGGTILIKGEKLQDGKQRLYITTVKKIIYSERKKTDDSMAQPARMAILGNQIYRVGKEHGIIKIHGVAWKSPQSMNQRLAINGNGVVLNNNKTPLHWETLKYDNITQAIRKFEQSILNLNDIKWVD